jgi:hypothetical protein
VENRKPTRIRTEHALSVDLGDLGHTLREAAQKRERRETERERRRFMPITATVGTCALPGCGGDIVYESRFEIADPGNMVFGGPNRMREHTDCRCGTCGIAYSPYHKPFRKQISEKRILTDDEDV